MSWHYRLRRQLVFIRQLFWESFRQRFLVSFIATIAFGILIAVLNSFFYDTKIWDSFVTDKDIENMFCEFTDMKRLIRQPINTFTNFIYIVNGMFFWSKGMEDIKKKRAYNLITANHFYSFTVSIICFYVFASSTFFHSSLTEFASDMDFSSVYSITLFPLMYFTHRVSLSARGLKSNVKYWYERLALVIVFFSLYLVLTFLIPMKYAHQIVASFIVILFSLGYYIERKEKGHANKKYLWGTLITIVLALIFFKFDFAKIMCEPHFIIHPHSLWHIFNGLSIFYLYLYIRSEGYKPEYDDMRTNLHLIAEEKVKEQH